MRCDRRSFVNRSLAVAGALMTGAATSEAAAPETDPRNTELLSRMRWMNEPASYKIRGETMVVHSRSKTDFWRKTFYGYITDNGHFFYLEANGDFTFQARVNGQYAALYDQSRPYGAARCRKLDEVRDGILRRTAPRERSLYPRLLRLVNDAGPLRYGGNLVASSAQKRFD